LVSAVRLWRPYKIGYNVTGMEKPIDWRGSSLDDLREFPEPAAGGRL
jgi:hypothetical protein